jgi:hypothetical protein
VRLVDPKRATYFGFAFFSQVESLNNFPVSPGTELADNEANARCALSMQCDSHRIFAIGNGREVEVRVDGPSPLPSSFRARAENHHTSYISGNVASDFVVSKCSQHGLQHVLNDVVDTGVVGARMPADKSPDSGLENAHEL